MDTLCYSDELLSLKWKNINLNNGFLLIDREHLHRNRYKARELVVELPDNCINLLRQYKEYKNNKGIKTDDNDYVFTKCNSNKAWEGKELNFSWYKFREAHGFNITLHDLKNYFYIKFINEYKMSI